MKVYFLVVWLGFAATGVSGGAQKAEPAAKPEAVKPDAAKAEKKQTPAQVKTAEKKHAVSEAEQIIRLQKHLDADTKNLEKTNRELYGPDSEYQRAEAAFKKLETVLSQKRVKLKKLTAADASADTGELQRDISSLERQRGLARDRFDIAIKEHKILQDSSALLAVKIAKTRRAIALLQGVPPVPVQQAGSAPPSVKDAQPPAQPEPPVHAGSAELRHAQKNVAARDAEAKTAEEKLKSVEARILFSSKSIDVEKRILATLHEKAAYAARMQAALHKELERKRADGVPQLELAPLLSRLADTDKLVGATAKELRATGAYLNGLEVNADKLQADKRLAQDEADRKAHEAQAAEKQLEYLQSPWALHNLIAWAWDHVPPILFVLLAVLGLQWVVRVASRRLMHWMTRQHFRALEQDRENRADTLAAVFRNTASFFIVLAGGLMIMQTLGIPIMPLLGGAAAGGLAFAFGAQNLIKDYLCGFMVIFEDQYGINDVVKIAGITGQVESITLRMTVLRDNEGTVHFIPHGTIATVSNLTHRWARACFEIRVAYSEDVDRVMQVLVELCKTMRTDQEFGRFILDDPEMLGVDQMNENGVTIQFQLRTSPLKQWPVKRELLRRIKAKFDELGIELPHLEWVHGAHAAPSANGELATAH